ncbi:MAG: hypothetical protein HQ495_04750 [Alphaproteobacteria bacterium]|nr:hypothetical protein [Alphaproteobacteria bacterium]
MPAMIHGEVKLYESLAIVRYVDATFGGPPLIPDDPLTRARVLGATSVAIDGLDPPRHDGSACRRRRGNCSRLVRQRCRRICRRLGLPQAGLIICRRMISNILQDMIDRQHRETVVGVAGIDEDIPTGTKGLGRVTDRIRIGLPIETAVAATVELIEHLDLAPPRSGSSHDVHVQIVRGRKHRRVGLLPC